MFSKQIHEIPMFSLNHLSGSYNMHNIMCIVGIVLDEEIFTNIISWTNKKLNFFRIFIKQEYIYYMIIDDGHFCIRLTLIMSTGKQNTNFIYNNNILCS